VSRKVERIVLYDGSGPSSLDIGEIAEYLGRMLPTVEVEVREAFPLHHMGGDKEALRMLARKVASLRVARANSPELVGEPLPAEVEYEFKRLSNPWEGLSGTLYCGFGLQALYREILPEREARLKVVHIAVERALLGTFEEAEGRWHARAVVLGFPSLISLRGLVEAPAGPPEFHVMRGLLPQLAEAERERFKERMLLGLQDPRLTEVAKGYALQALFYQALGEAFCNDPDCRLFNAHRQEEMLRAQLDGAFELCPRHERLLAQISGTA